ncbi:hypothetical protein G6M89_07005 [Natronolimnobius sp. AArcel1]|uniref:hypothetical protein n=1 Tax=Natronolimnobius sp. AArcel1 TaxID=1679093 RepID=UPI0013EBEBE7|nr:hypothetical protein [Natronolimnobius sp. AArcel1]NGM68759.1 hypothetical protein [Natronolimnobius sp. AArcel1]
MVPTPDEPPGDDLDSNSDASSATQSGSPFPRHVSRASDRFGSLLPFVIVPFVLSLFPLEQFMRTLEPRRGVSINLELQFPSPILDLWSFIDAPEPVTSMTVGEPTSPGTPGSDPFATGTGPGSSSEFTIDTPFESVVMPAQSFGLEIFGWIALLIAIYGVIGAAITAGYLGGIDRRLRGERAAPLTCIAQFAPRMLLYYAVFFGAMLLALPILLIAPSLLLLAIPLLILIGYLFYAVPFLLIVDDAGVLESFRRSYSFALSGGPYLSFALWHVVVTGICSLVLSVLASGGGVGVLIALIVVVPLSLILTGATVSFCQELVDDDSSEPDTGTRDAQSWQ